MSMQSRANDGGESTQHEQRGSLHTMPPLVLARILHFCPFADVKTCSRTCRRLRDVLLPSATARVAMKQEFWAMYAPVSPPQCTKAMTGALEIYALLGDAAGVDCALLAGAVPSGEMLQRAIEFHFEDVALLLVRRLRVATRRDSWRDIYKNAICSAGLNGLVLVYRELRALGTWKSFVATRNDDEDVQQLVRGVCGAGSVELLDDVLRDVQIRAVVPIERTMVRVALLSGGACARRMLEEPDARPHMRPLLIESAMCGAVSHVELLLAGDVQGADIAAALCAVVRRHRCKWQLGRVTVLLVRDERLSDVQRKVVSGFASAHEHPHPAFFLEPY